MELLLSNYKSVIEIKFQVYFGLNTQLSVLLGKKVSADDDDDLMQLLDIDILFHFVYGDLAIHQLGPVWIDLIHGPH